MIKFFTLKSIVPKLILLPLLFHFSLMAKEVISTGSKPAKDSSKSIRISTRPINVLIDEYNLDLDYAFINHSSMGFRGNYQKSLRDQENSTFQTVGVGYNYYFNQQAFKDGWLIGVELGYVKGNTEISSSSAISNSEFRNNHRKYHFNIEGNYLGLGGKYLWAWDYFNLGLGAELKRYQLELTSNSSNGYGIIIPKMLSTGHVGNLVVEMGVAF